jgi:predicted branched-subunit amino acid permease
MAMGHEDSVVNARTAFWSTGFAIFVLWNGGTLVGALGAGLLGDPARWGLDAAIPAAFLALMWPRLSTSVARVTAAVAIGLALIATPLLPAGVPVLLAGLSSVGVGLLYQLWRPARTPPTVLP